jgi:shikimate kinase
VGRILAGRLGRCFVETDDLITATEGRSIPEIQPPAQPETACPGVRVTGCGRR